MFGEQWIFQHIEGATAKVWAGDSEIGFENPFEVAVDGSSFADSPLGGKVVGEYVIDKGEYLWLIACCGVADERHRMKSDA